MDWLIYGVNNWSDYSLSYARGFVKFEVSVTDRRVVTHVTVMITG